MVLRGRRVRDHVPERGAGHGGLAVLLVAPQLGEGALDLGDVDGALGLEGHFVILSRHGAAKDLKLPILRSFAALRTTGVTASAIFSRPFRSTGPPPPAPTS